MGRVSKYIGTHMADRCYDCRAACPKVVGIYGSWIEYRCTIGKNKDMCKKKIRTYKELMAAEEIYKNSNNHA